MSQPPLPSLPPIPGAPGLPPLPELAKPPANAAMPIGSTETQSLLQMLSMVEAVAFASICSCIATNRLLLDKKIISTTEFAREVDDHAKIMAETILKDRDTDSFFQTIDLMKGLAE